MKHFARIAACCLTSFIITSTIKAQPERWQQHIQYQIQVQLNDSLHRLTGQQKMLYTNNSPDTLKRLFMHAYWNAFKPGSMMDVRSQEAGKQMIRGRNGSENPDWDRRVKDRIAKLKPSEIGYQLIKNCKVNGVIQKTIEHETIVEIVLAKPILPKSTTQIDLQFEAQVPVQIRRSGRNNAEGIMYSMSQWYPKMCEYDYQGWNANPYVGREFYGVWGNYDVTITVPKQYMVASTGTLKNANSIGMGYDSLNGKITPQKGETNSWHFVANQVHDFVWAADTAYIHLTKKVRNNLTLHAFYKKGTASTDSAWQSVLWAAEKVLPFIEANFGAYPYPQYSFIQGGDGGMEYAMATLLKDAGLGTVFHEWMHSWYQHILGSNESLFSWMDEGFTEYASDEVGYYFYSVHAQQSPWISANTKQYYQKWVEETKQKLPFKQADSYAGYFNLAKSGFEEPLSTHADHYNTNFAYSLASYSKGAVFLNQLGYIISDSVLKQVLQAYYNQWKFKHPNANDFVRVAEKVSGLQLQWYKEYWMNSTKQIDYALGNIFIDSVTAKPAITLKRLGKMPMPIDVLITYKSGVKEWHYIPTGLLLGYKPAEDTLARTVHPEWMWTHPEYTFYIGNAISQIKSIEIDPSFRMADVNRQNNKLVIPD